MMCLFSIRSSFLFKAVFKAVFKAISATVLVSLVGLAGCTSKRAELGTAENPVKLFFIPSVDSKLLEDKSSEIQAYLSNETGYAFRVSIPSSYVAVVEAFGTNRADVAALNSFGYILASQKYGAEARLTVMRFGRQTYQGQIVVRADSGIDSIEELNGKKFAYVDPASTSGYMMPAKLFLERGIKPSETVFSYKHDNVISMVYQRQVDAGATFYSPVEEGQIQDARRLVKTQYPDVESVIKILHLTDELPNDPVVFRAGMPEEMKQKIVQAFHKYINTDEGKENFKAIYSVTGFIDAKDSDYDQLRETLKVVGLNPESLVK